MKKILYMTNIPVPYKIDFFKELNKYVDLTVAFERKAATNRNKEWMSGNETELKIIHLNGINVGEENAFCPQICKIISDGNYDEIVASVYQTPTEMLATQYMKRKKIPFYISTDGGFVKPDGKIKWKIKQHFMTGAKGYFSPNSMTDNYFVNYGVARELIQRYPFTSIRDCDILDTCLSIAEKNIIKDKLNIREEKVIVGVGQIIERKGWDILIRAVVNLPPEIGIYIIGGTATDSLLQIIHKYKMKNIHFVDFKSTGLLRDYYKLADVFVLPTREDIWGLVINEAMSCGLPIVTTQNCMAGLELVKENINGYLVPSDDENQLGEKLLKLINDPQLCEQMGKESLQIIKKYTIEQMAISYAKNLTK